MNVGYSSGTQTPGLSIYSIDLLLVMVILGVRFVGPQIKFGGGSGNAADTARCFWPEYLCNYYYR